MIFSFSQPSKALKPIFVTLAGMVTCSMVGMPLKALALISVIPSGMIKDVIKAVKSWKKDHEYKIPSFHVEEVAIKIFNAYSYQSVEEGIRKWFTKAEYYISKDKFNSDKQYDDTIDAVKEVAKQLEEARKKEDDKKTSEAITIWHGIFGSKFPTISKDEARNIGAKLSEGTLRYSAAAGLSTCAGRAMGASKGFYGEE